METTLFRSDRNSRSNSEIIKCLQLIQDTGRMGITLSEASGIGRNDPSRDDVQPKTRLSLALDLLRVEPPNDVYDSDKEKSDRLTDLLIGFAIFAIAFWFRYLFRSVFLEEYGIFVFDLQISENDPFGFGKFLGLLPGEVAYTEGYHDFYSYYIPYVNEFGQGWNPYKGSNVPGNSISGYVYGPYYIVSISFFHKWLGWGIEDSIVFSNILFDSLTYVMVYLLAKKVTGNVIAMLFALISSFSPISLFYIAFRGLNAPIMNFSFLLFVYFYMEKKDGWAMFFLAFSLLTKQFPLFMAMPVGFWMVRRYGFSKGLSYYLLGIIFAFVLAIPYILITPTLFVLRLFGPGTGKSVIYCPKPTEATNLFHSNIPIEACNQQLGIEYANNVNLDMLIANYELLFVLVNKHYLFFISLFIISWVGFTGYHYLEENPRLYYAFFAAYYLVAHATIARGIYKYYITFLVPLVVLSFVRGNPKHSWNVSLGKTLHNSWKIWLSPKYRHQEANLRYWITGINLVITTIGIFWIVNGLISMVTVTPTNRNLMRLLIYPAVAICLIRPKGGGLSRSDFQPSNMVAKNLLFLIPMYSILMTIMLKLGVLYFSSNTRFIYNVTLFVIFALAVLSLSWSIRYITQKSRTVAVNNNFSKRQILLDLVNLLIAFVIIAYWHVGILTVHRFYTSLFLLVFSFLPLAMLGSQVWKTGITVPLNTLKQFSRLHFYYESIWNDTQSETHTKTLYEPDQIPD